MPMSMTVQHEAQKVQSKFIHPLTDLRVGDYYFVPLRKMRAVSPYVSARGKELGVKFATRTTHVREQLGGLMECSEKCPEAMPAVKVIRIE